MLIFFPRGGGIPRRYITHELNFLAWLPYVSGTTRLKLTQQGMQKVKLPLPPLPEQRRIVANLDSLFECTRRAREELSHIPRLIENYKKAILEAAFRGDLTKDWRASHPGQTVKADSNSIDNRCRPLPELPSAWSWSSVASASIVSGGLTKNARRRDLAKKVPYLRVANVYANELRLDDIQEIGCTPAEYEKTHLRLGDLLVVEGNGSIDQIGRVAMWDNSISNCSHQNHLIRVRARLTITPEYLLFWLLSPLGRQSIERVASSSSGLHTLSISKVSTLPVPMCTIEEMKEITARINVYLSQIEGVFADSAQAEHLLDRLDQANLSKAFRGELVPQDPTDEPASVLLQRIRSVDGAQLQSHSRARRRRNQGVVA
jgi:type I restriction enzyme S subunit